ncbi:E3 ubiquitin-protein ligase Smurf1-like, partial [Acyrthosiphon pisum]|uniref:HECT-type E3 ubiquitin transferase n=1 Tax=Acyrthosiphon pisum TaxID=7029 RepID=A0A8R2JVR7_ACYPI
VDPELHRSLTYILENKLDKDIIDTTFAVEESSSGVLKLHELKTGGQNIQLTEDNKKEYVEYVNGWLPLYIMLIFNSIIQTTI